jgi:hypothetical protein
MMSTACLAKGEVADDGAHIKHSGNESLLGRMRSHGTSGTSGNGRAAISQFNKQQRSFLFTAAAKWKPMRRVHRNYKAVYD